MKQVLQSLKDGQIDVAEIPAPVARPGKLLIHTTLSLVSAGTERMLLEFGKGNLLSKALQQPDKVREVFAKIRTDGVGATIGAVRSKLHQPIALGYCNVGHVAEIGAGVTGFAPGDRVVSNGNHAEVVSVPKNLCAKIPEGVSDEAASFTVLSAIGLQGIRLSHAALGECVVVTGLGLIGLMTVQMLRAQGCRVLGIDIHPARLALAQEFGAETVNIAAGEDPLVVAERFSRGAGVDAVLITASTRSNDPVSQAARMCRQRGRIVLVGVTGLQLSRAEFYAKELTFQVSCSYGPGRYDQAYEEGGHDYPIGFVRWTEQRNFEAVLDMMAAGTLNVAPLITHRFPIERAGEALGLLTKDKSAMGIVLEYSPDVAGEALNRRRVPLAEVTGPSIVGGSARIGFLGAGNYAARVLIPAFRAAGATLAHVVSSGGVTAVHAGRRNAVREAMTDETVCLESPDIDAVVIGTRHDAHARQVLAALRNGKHVYCEKPLCLTQGELSEIEIEARARPKQLLMVGFNRRFAPQVVRMKELLASVPGPKSFIITVNAGAIPVDHWTQDRAVGGGRIIGEACHFIDLMRHLAGAPIVGQSATRMVGGGHRASPTDTASITLAFADGSEGTVHYFANGNNGYPKERVEVFASGRILQLNNFHHLRGWGWPGFRKMDLWKQNKGAVEAARAFTETIRTSGIPPIPLHETLETSLASIRAAEDLS